MLLLRNAEFKNRCRRRLRGFDSTRDVRGCRLWCVKLNMTQPNITKCSLKVYHGQHTNNYSSSLNKNKKGRLNMVVIIPGLLKFPRLQQTSPSQGKLIFSYPTKRWYSFPRSHKLSQAVVNRQLWVLVCLWEAPICLQTKYCDSVLNLSEKKANIAL